MRRALGVLAATGLLAGVAATAAPVASAAPPQLLAGVGRADITPVTGTFKGGWVNSEAKALGQHTRLYARAVVLRQGHTKIALVAEDLTFVGAGMIHDAAALLQARGRAFSEQSIIDSATHTHGSQSGFMNFSAYNSVLPTTGNLTEFKVTNTAADPTMYAFMVRQLALAISRADDNLGPAVIGWSNTDLLGVTQNRSLEAHLANFGILVPVGQGSVSQDPGGYPDTIDPRVDVLRVDRVTGGRHIPLGIFSTFANHGTVVKITFSYYTADHQGAAERVSEAAIRQAGNVPAGQDVVNAFANSDAGDMTAGIAHSGPADAESVGRQEADAMLRAWRAAGHAMTGDAKLHYLWTRVCFCGQGTSEGPADTTPWLGQAAGAGSEEGRAIFFYTGVAREGDMLPAPVGPQGYKVTVIPEKGSFPQAVPLALMRIGDRLIATVPGEPTVGAGQLLRDAIGPVVSQAGIARVVLAGYAGDYLDYFTTPAEYDRQHYEGGSDVYGRTSLLVLRDGLVDLAHRFAAGEPAPDPYPFDPTNGVTPNSMPYGDGATSATSTAQPAHTAVRLSHAVFSWQGGPNGLDRPVDHEFVTVSRLVGPTACQRRASITLNLRRGSRRVQRVRVYVDGRRTATIRGNRRRVRVGLGSARQTIARVRLVVVTNRGRYTLRRTVRICPPPGASAWRSFQTDLGMQIAWSSDSSGRYGLQWEVPLDAPAGLYRFHVTGKRYTLTSNQFQVQPTTSLAIERAAASAGRVAIRLGYPVATVDKDLTFRPQHASGGTVTFTVGARQVTVRQQDGTDFSIAASPGSSVTIAAGAARDRFGNVNGQAATLQA
jgi:neutral ceramidase